MIRTYSMITKAQILYSSTVTDTREPMKQYNQMQTNDSLPNCVKLDSFDDPIYQPFMIIHTSLSELVLVVLDVVSNVSVVSKDRSVKDTPPRELGDPERGDDLPRPDLQRVEINKGIK